MYKRGVFFNTEFKKRWFVLKGNLLFYFKSKAGLTDPTGVIFLEDATVDINPIVFVGLGSDMSSAFTLPCLVALR